MDSFHTERTRRRTFAIISHPDAGKTTLTEKLLLYGGAIHLAGSVTARKNRRQATSDWMELERQRGISITSTVLQFEYHGYKLNLLDTPGHEDFSEDTYRTLLAADSAVMLIDSAKGVEPQTRKLFQVCRSRGIPIFTFINKMDRPGKDPLALLTEIEEVLGIGAVPMNWPIGTGVDFRGVYDRHAHKAYLFERTEHGAHRAPVQASSLDDPSLTEALGLAQHQQLMEEIELLDIAGETFDTDRVANGELTPTFFGSAVTNFGVEPFLEQFVTMAPEPSPRRAEDRLIAPEEPEFRGFVFKIQANMNPNHRDCVAFMRVVSGKFERDMTAHHARLKRPVRLTRPQQLFAQERTVVEEAYPGDIVGLTNPGLFAIGDTLCTGPTVRFVDIPRFLPEHFALLQNKRIEKYKQFQKGIEQLRQEGVMQVFYDAHATRRDPILAVVGRLQFEVAQHRLLSEYGVETRIEMLPYKHVRWLGIPPAERKPLPPVHGTHAVEDDEGNAALLFESDWAVNYVQREHAHLKLIENPPGA